MVSHYTGEMVKIISIPKTKDDLKKKSLLNQFITQLNVKFYIVVS